MVPKVDGEQDRLERLRFRFEAAVIGSDGPIGNLRQILVEPGSPRVSGLVIRTGFLFAGEVRLPLGSVVSTRDDEIQVSLSSGEARELRQKQAQVFRVRTEDVCKPLRPAAPVLTNSIRVMARGGGQEGRLRQVVVDPSSGQIEELILETGRFTRQCRRLDAACVRTIAETGIEVEAASGALEALPLFREDRDLRAAILDAWFYDEDLRPTFLRAPLEVRVWDGIATLEGYVPSRGIRKRLEAQARSVSGLREVRGTLVTDDELVQGVRCALGEDLRTRMLRPRVRSVLGLICLEGEAPDEHTREAASEVAATVSRVRGVINRLRVGEKESPGSWSVCCTHL